MRSLYRKTLNVDAQDSTVAVHVRPVLYRFLTRADVLRRRLSRRSFSHFFQDVKKFVHLFIVSKCWSGHHRSGVYPGVAGFPKWEACTVALGHFGIAKELKKKLFILIYISLAEKALD